MKKIIITTLLFVSISIFAQKKEHQTTTFNNWVKILNYLSVSDTISCDSISVYDGTTRVWLSPWKITQMAANLGYTAENVANKGQINGYASLDASGLVPTSQLPTLVISNTYIDTGYYAMLTGVRNVGDISVRTDSTKTFILKDTPSSVYGNWVILQPPTSAPVQSVNSRVGNIVLTQTDVGIPAYSNGKWLKSGTSDMSWADIVWGNITGTLSNQTDLNSALSGKEPTISTGTTTQFWRGDKTFSQVNLTNSITGTLPISSGGTGQTSANNALNALLPAQSAKNGYVLESDGYNTSWQPLSSFITETDPVYLASVAGNIDESDTTRYGLKQPLLVSGTNIKTINSTSLLGSGNILIPTGGVTAVTATSPIVSSGGTTPLISIPAATTSTNGYLSSTNWNIFNNKIGFIDTLSTGKIDTKYQRTKALHDSLIHYPNRTELGDTALAIRQDMGTGNLDSAKLVTKYDLTTGISGGRTVTGGTGTTDKLILKGTSGNGTSTDSAFMVKVGNNGSNTAIRVLNSGAVNVGIVRGTDEPNDVLKISFPSTDWHFSKQHSYGILYAGPWGAPNQVYIYNPAIWSGISPVGDLGAGLGYSNYRWNKFYTKHISESTVGNKVTVSDTLQSLGTMIVPDITISDSTAKAASTAFVKRAVAAGGGGGTTYTASNGITKVGNDYQLAEDDTVRSVYWHDDGGDNLFEFDRINGNFNVEFIDPIKFNRHSYIRMDRNGSITLSGRGINGSNYCRVLKDSVGLRYVDVDTSKLTHSQSLMTKDWINNQINYKLSSISGGVTPTDGFLDWQTNKYAIYPDSTGTGDYKGMYYGTQVPTKTTRVNLNGRLFATNFKFLNTTTTIIGDSTSSTLTGAKNTIIGYGAGKSIGTAGNNVLIGYNAGCRLDDGYSTSQSADNVLIGSETGMYLVSSRAYSTFIGTKAGRNVPNNGYNTLIGSQTGMNMSGNYNVALGNNAGESSVGNYNTFIGRQAGQTNSGTNVLSLGYHAGYYNTKDSRLYINSIGRGDLLGDTTKSIIYGVQNAIVSNQILYLNAGNVIVTGQIKATQPTGSLTDGIPTASEIVTILGTAASKGAGYQATIKDNNGTGLLYKVESDGTDWFYTVMTKSL